MTKNMSESVRLEDLTIGYQKKGSVKTVASGINAAIRQGELTCLIGANGVGKSTLLRTLSAFQPALAGDIRIVLPDNTEQIFNVRGGVVKGQQNDFMLLVQ